VLEIVLVQLPGNTTPSAERQGSWSGETV
jgi:hypothetical protein